MALQIITKLTKRIGRINERFLCELIFIECRIIVALIEINTSLIIRVV